MTSKKDGKLLRNIFFNKQSFPCQKYLAVSVCCYSPVTQNRWFSPPITGRVCVDPPVWHPFRLLGTPTEAYWKIGTAQRAYFGTLPNFWWWKRQYKWTVPHHKAPNRTAPLCGNKALGAKPSCSQNTSIVFKKSNNPCWTLVILGLLSSVKWGASAAPRRNTLSIPLGALIQMRLSQNLIVVMPLIDCLIEINSRIIP